MNKVQPHAKYRPGDVVTLKAVRASEMGVFWTQAPVIPTTIFYCINCSRKPR